MNCRNLAKAGSVLCISDVSRTGIETVPWEYLIARYRARLSGAAVVSTGTPHTMASSRSETFTL